jgi:hypothetical protein
MGFINNSSSGEMELVFKCGTQIKITFASSGYQYSGESVLKFSALPQMKSQFASDIIPFQLQRRLHLADFGLQCKAMDMRSRVVERWLPLGGGGGGKSVKNVMRSYIPLFAVTITPKRTRLARNVIRAWKHKINLNSVA